MTVSGALARGFAGIWLAVMAVGLAGCASSQPELQKPVPPPSPSGLALPFRAPPSAPTEPRWPEMVEVGRSVAGRPVEALVFEGSRGCVLILGGIHGDEPLAVELVEHLAAHLKANPDDCDGRTVVLIPCANPDGLAAGTRLNARGVDVNRNFATSNFASSSRHGRNPLSEPESRALSAAIARYHPSCVVSVHGPLDCIDPDGGSASKALARLMALYSPLPFRDLPAMPGSLGSYAGDQLHLRMITYELDRSDVPLWSPSAYLDRHLKPLLTAIEKCDAGLPERRIGR